LGRYFETWWEIVSAPILFYTVLERESWREKALDFLVWSTWILSFFITCVIFVVQVYPIGKTLVEGLTFFKLLLVSPVVLVITLMFFAIIFMILGGFVMFFAFGAFYAVGYLLYWLSKLAKGSATLPFMLQSVFYSAAVWLFYLFGLFLVILADTGFLSFDLFKIGFDLLYYFSAFFVYGLWSIAVRKVGGHTKAQAFLIAAVPFILLLLFGIFFDLKGFEKIRPVLGI
jgi:hypothetical protein